MATVTLLPGALVVREDPASLGSMIVGDPPQWADGSDATYGLSYRDPSVGLGWVAANCDLLSSTGGVTAIGVTLRMKYDVGGGTPAGPLQVEIRRTSIGSLLIFADLTDFPDDGAIHDYAYMFTDADYAAAGIVAHSVAGLAAELAANTGALDLLPGFVSGVRPVCTVYEAAIVVTYGRRPFTRLYPRDDRYGPSARIYPPPRSQQTAGRITGYQ